MESHELVRAAFKLKPAKTVAGDLYLSVSHIRKWARPKWASGITNPVGGFNDYLHSTGHEASLQWVCAQHGGTFVRDPALASPPPPLHLATDEAVAAMGDCLSAVAEVDKHGAQDPAANARYLAAVQTLKAKCETLALGLKKDCYTQSTILLLWLRFLATGELPEMLGQV